MTKSDTDKKISLLQEIEYSNDFELVSNILLQWQKQKPNDTLDKVIAAFNRMYFYTFNIQAENEILRGIVSEYRSDKNRAIERARKSENKFNELEQKSKTLKL